MKTIQKIAIVLLIVMIAVAVFTPNIVRAADEDATAVLGDLEEQITSDEDTQTSLSSIVGSLLGFLQVASALMAVLMIALTGFNYIVSTPEVKEEMKKKFLPIIIGIILVFGAVSIGKFLLGVAG